MIRGPTMEAWWTSGPLGLALVSLLMAAPVSADEDDARPPNVVIVLVDDLGWRDLGCTGSTYHETPHIDRLAREGMQFTQAYAACAVCSPSRAALLTGRYPHRVGITDWIHHASPAARRALKAGRHLDGFDEPRGRPLLTPRNRAWLDASEHTLAELLRERGYATCHVGKWHLGPAGHLPDDQGFDENHGGFQVGQPPSYFDPYANKRFPGIHGLAPRKPGEHLTDREADEAVAFIAKNAKRPFFLHLSHYAVHAPLQAREAVIERYRTKPAGTQRVPVYAAMVEAVDDALGRVLQALEEHGIDQRTLVVFTSDNGGASHFPATDNAPLRKGKGFPYEGGIRVPLLVRWPGHVAPHTTSDVPTIGTDVFATVAAAVGATPPEQRPIDGVSLLPVLAGKGTVVRDTLLWHFPHYWWGTRVKPYSIVREGDWKLIHHYEDGRLELYDLAKDHAEAHDLSSKHPQVARRLDAKLRKLLTEQGARFPKPSPSAKRGPK